MRTVTPEEIVDAVLDEQAPTALIVLTGAIASLPLLALLGLAGGIVAGIVDPPGIERGIWLLGGAVAIVTVVALSGAGAALLRRWGRRTAHWGDFAGGLVMWPASFPIAYLFVVVIHGSISHALWPADVDLRASAWHTVAAETVALAAVIATIWFGSWREIYLPILRRVGHVDRAEIMAGVLRQHFRTHWLVPREPEHAEAPRDADRPHQLRNGSLPFDHPSRRKGA